MFKDRKDAGRQLGEALVPYNEDDLVIHAIPKGGVEIARYVGKALDKEFHIVIARRLRHLNQPELAFGAIAEDKSLYLNPSVQARLPKQTIEKAVSIEEKEIQKQMAKYRKDKPLPPLENKTIVLVDDGIATGSTLMVTIDLCRKQDVGRLIVAVPVASLNMYRKLKATVDDVVILETPLDFLAVSQAYREFINLTDRDVVSFIKQQRTNSNLLSG